MQALQLVEPGKWAMIEVPEPSDLQPGEALVRVEAVGICGTDYGGYLGKMPFFSYPRIRVMNSALRYLVLVRVSQISPSVIAVAWNLTSIASNVIHAVSVKPTVVNIIRPLASTVMAAFGLILLFQQESSTHLRIFLPSRMRSLKLVQSVAMQ